MDFVLDWISVSSAAATAPAQIPEPPIITVVKHAVAPPLAAPAPPLIVTGRGMFIEDWQLAKRYRRKALSVEEIDCINVRTAGGLLNFYLICVERLLCITFPREAVVPCDGRQTKKRPVAMHYFSYFKNTPVKFQGFLLRLARYRPRPF